jgi:hypothetical protein
MKSKTYHTFGTTLIINRKIVLRGQITYIHDRSLHWLGTGISIKGGGVKRVLWVKIFPLNLVILP